MIRRAVYALAERAERAMDRILDGVLWTGFVGSLVLVFGLGVAFLALLVTVSAIEAVLRGPS